MTAIIAIASIRFRRPGLPSLWTWQANQQASRTPKTGAATATKERDDDPEHVVAEADARHIWSIERLDPALRERISSSFDVLAADGATRGIRRYGLTAAGAMGEGFRHSRAIIGPARAH